MVILSISSYTGTGIRGCIRTAEFHYLSFFIFPYDKANALIGLYLLWKYHKYLRIRTTVDYSLSFDILQMIK